MNAALRLNGIPVAWTVAEVGPLMVEVAQSKVDEAALAGWLRGKAGA